MHIGQVIKDQAQYSGDLAYLQRGEGSGEGGSVMIHSSEHQNLQIPQSSTSMHATLTTY